MMPLSYAEHGQPQIIRKIGGSPEVKKHLEDLGFNVGSEVCIVSAPCFAAIGAIKREMNNPKWTAFAILYQCGFAYAVSLMINQFGNAFTGNLNIIGLIFAIAVLCLMIYMLFFKKNKEANKLTVAKALK